MGNQFKAADLTGKRFGRLVVESRSRKAKAGVHDASCQKIIVSYSCTVS